MSHRDVLLVVFAALSLLLGLALVAMRRRYLRSQAPSGRRILFPFDSRTLSLDALDVALRIADSERAVLVATHLSLVPMSLALDAPLSRQNDAAVDLLDELELRAASAGVEVDARIEAGRTYRHALARAYRRQDLDRVVIAARSGTGHGFGSEDIAWALDHTLPELLVLKPTGVPPGTPPLKAPMVPSGAQGTHRRMPANGLTRRG